MVMQVQSRFSLMICEVLSQRESGDICILYGFPCEVDFSRHKSQNPTHIESACDSEITSEKIHIA